MSAEAEDVIVQNYFKVGKFEHAIARTDLELLAEQGSPLAQACICLFAHVELADTNQSREMHHTRGDALFKWLNKEADSDNPHAQFLLAEFLFNGVCCLQDQQKGDELIMKSALLGCSTAQIILADNYTMGEDVERDEVEAFKWYKLAAEQGNVFALTSIGFSYKFGSGVHIDLEKALYYFMLAAERNVATAQRQVALAYEFGNGAIINKAEALKYYLLAANNGDAPSQLDLGNAYRYGTQHSLGEFVQVDRQKAFEWYKRAAENGEANAQNALGELYWEDRELDPANMALASDYYHRAADRGHIAAQFQTGLFYEMGMTEVGTPKPELAFQYYKLAADQGHMVAQYKVGLAFEEGIDWEFDAHPALAFEYFKQSADSGFLPAQVKVGLTLEVNGNKVDPIDRLRYLKVAADRGSAQAQVALGDLYWCGGVGAENNVAEARRYLEMAAANDQDPGSAIVNTQAKENLSTYFPDKQQEAAKRAEAEKNDNEKHEVEDKDTAEGEDSSEAIKQACSAMSALVSATEALKTATDETRPALLAAVVRARAVASAASDLISLSISAKTERAPSISAEEQVAEEPSPSSQQSLQSVTATKSTANTSSSLCVLPRRPSSPPSTLQQLTERVGWVTKRSHWLKRWRRRYCRLHFARQELAFCRSEHCPAHIILCLQGLRSVCALGAKEVGKANVLQLITAQGVSFFLYTATAGERDAWVAAVELCAHSSVRSPAAALT